MFVGTTTPSLMRPAATASWISAPGIESPTFVFDKVIGSPLCGSGNASVEIVTVADASDGGWSAGSSVAMHGFTPVALPWTFT